MQYWSHKDGYINWHASGIDLVSISIDSPEEIHDGIRGKGVYHKVGEAFGGKLWRGCNAGIRSLGILHNGDIVGCTSIRKKKFENMDVKMESLIIIICRVIKAFNLLEL